ncbi:MAG: NADH:flavin oxidoreductase [Dehalococcoidales bacterium]|nr:NADH:flavin oxidoreductase [Dehalococcoidales bacterium]
MSSLFSEISIRNMKIKNRIVMPPMVCSGFTGEDGLFTLNNIERYRDRARGGVGMIIIEATCINKTGRLSPTQLGLWSDKHIKGFSRIAGYCHEYDTRVLVQLHHAGLAAAGEVTSDPVAPSDFNGLSRSNREIKARALTHAEIGAIQDEFVAAALRAQKAGLDGVELHGAHGYLISQFFSPLVNKREDDYGGSLVNRTRFAVEIIEKIRQAAGSDFIISCRIGCDEPDTESSIRIARALEEAGIDILHISRGMTDYIAGEITDVPVPAHFHYNSIVWRGAQIKEKVKVPVILVNGISTPLDAGYLVERNYADLVAVGRGLLVDPEWANKGQKYMQVIPCLRCKACSYHNRDSKCPQTKTMFKRRNIYY